jgi:hypothetical protein
LCCAVAAQFYTQGGENDDIVGSKIHNFGDWGFKGGGKKACLSSGGFSLHITQKTAVSIHYTGSDVLK